MTVSGRFTTVDGVGLRNSQLSVVVNGVKSVVRTDNQGVYNYTFNASDVGVNNVTVSYAGNSRYAKTSTNSTFKVKV